MARKENGNGTLPAEVTSQFEADAGMGLEHVGLENMQTPFLRLIQALSPQLKKSDVSFISGAQQGQIFNTVTGKTWTDSVTVVPVDFCQKMLEFVPRKAGGGFVGELSREDALQAVRDDAGMEILPSGNELVRTAQHYVKIVHDDGTLESAIVDMKKTQLKVSRKWITLIAMQKHNGSTLPSFANSYKLRSVEDGNDKGSWFSWSVALADPIPSLAAYHECKDFYQSIKRGEVRSLAPPSDMVLEDSAQDVPF
jgi:hypothetical protein|tara:strand:+ start:3408 stop:4166 length:759 start_codon:yes stop_codon:yes gene_type:complete